MKSPVEERAEGLTDSLTYVYSVWRECIKSIPACSLQLLQLQTTWEKDRAISIFKNGSGMKVIGAAECVNKNNYREKKWYLKSVGRDAERTLKESTGDIKESTISC